jgi:hypothetical protein
MPKWNTEDGKHPPDCKHCEKTIKWKSIAIWRDGEDIPVCKCHGLKMRWNKMPRLKHGGSWKCVARIKQWERKNRLQKLGLTEDQYAEMAKNQGGVCAICNGPPDTRWKKLAVDHCHKTGRVRGLLCMVCNTMLGRLENRWDKTMEYLKK